MSEGAEFSPLSVYQPITGWLTKSLGKIDLHVEQFPPPSCTRVGNHAGCVRWVITHMSAGGENVSGMGTCLVYK